jgi:hypothetical protein
MNHMNSAGGYRYHVLRTSRCDASARGVPQYLIYNGKEKRGLEGCGYRCLEDQMEAALRREQGGAGFSMRPIVVYQEGDSVHSPGRFVGVIDVSADDLARAVAARRFVEKVEAVGYPLGPIQAAVAGSPHGAEIGDLLAAHTRLLAATKARYEWVGMAARIRGQTLPLLDLGFG